MKIQIIKTILSLLFRSNKTNSKATYMKKNLENLTDIQRHVTMHDGTEKPFDNEYWDNKRQGIYVDIISGKALFSSSDKFDSKTGWPSFTKPLKEQEITSKTDNKLGLPRTEIRSKTADSHLGHVFNDGPTEEGGMRYCINSASLRFIPKENLKKEGYAEYSTLFEEIKNEDSKLEKAVMAGGCFWGMEELIRKLDGVIDIKAGYCGGSIKSPDYKLVSSGVSGHAESIEVIFNPTKISFEAILRFFFQIHNPTTLDQQGNDVGSQYRSAIFYIGDEQKKIAEDLIIKANQSGIFPGKVVTKVTSFDNFYTAEDRHQDYLQNNPGGYTCHKIRKDWVF